jgi:glycosyltransferase involved in cell wall biosynthesis
MRIGMILDASFPPDPRVENEALSLIRKGHEVYLFSLDFKGRSGIDNYKGIYIVRYPAGQLLYKLSALVYTFPFYRWKVSCLITHFIKMHHVHALHVHDMVIAETVFHANRPFKLPVVLDLHENRPEIMKQYKHANTWSGKLLINLKKWSAKYYLLAAQAQHVVVVTEAAKRDILENTGRSEDSIAVVPNSVRISEFLNSPIQPEIVTRMHESFNLLYIGDTSIRRGIDTALYAVSILKEKIPTIKLWLIGKSSADEELKNLSRKLNLDKHVEFEGWRDPATFTSYLFNTNVALSPLKRNLHHDTTYANKLFQYMACGKPLVVSDCTAQAELINAEQCGLVHQADNDRDLADKINFFYAHTHEALTMGENGRRAVVERWNWDLTVGKLLDIYKSGF